MSNTQQPLALHVLDAGRTLGLGRRATYELVRSGEIPSIRLGKRRYVPVAVIQELLAQARLQTENSSSE